MPRKGFVSRRQVPNDSVYGSDLVQKFINSMMWQGRRSKAQKIFYTAMENIAQKTNDDPLKTFKKAVENVKPLVEVNQFRRQSLAIRWLLLYSRDRAGKTMIERLTDELMDAANGKGGAVKKKEDVHRMAEANKAFAHYRW
ncbi:MAG: 30S ribosomal protein S7 [Acidobacteria bacterium]|nr:30S ribosomal protein S7 [Acidobacteriota bacterium]